MEDLAGKKMKKKCTKCGEVKSSTAYYGIKTKETHCKTCTNARVKKYALTERGYLNKKYRDMIRKDSKKHSASRRHFTFEEFLAAFEKHKSIYGMRSAWGPGVDNIEQHLPITTIVTFDPDKKAKRISSNLSVDRLNPSGEYTLQNIIFIRGDENSRKKDTTYNDCLIHIKLYEERYGTDDLE